MGRDNWPTPPIVPSVRRLEGPLVSLYILCLFSFVVVVTFFLIFRALERVLKAGPCHLLYNKGSDIYVVYISNYLVSIYYRPRPHIERVSALHYINGGLYEMSPVSK